MGNGDLPGSEPTGSVAAEPETTAADSAAAAGTGQRRRSLIDRYRTSRRRHRASAEPETEPAGAAEAEAEAAGAAEAEAEAAGAAEAEAEAAAEAAESEADTAEPAETEPDADGDDAEPVSERPPPLTEAEAVAELDRLRTDVETAAAEAVAAIENTPVGGGFAGTPAVADGKRARTEALAGPLDRLHTATLALCDLASDRYRAGDKPGEKAADSAHLAASKKLASLIRKADPALLAELRAALHADD